MKKLILIILVIILAVATGSYISKSYRNEQYRIVKLKGCNAYANFPKSEFLCIAGISADSISALPLYDGDLLYLFTENSNLPFYRYNKSDGNFLEFYADDFLLYLNGKIIAIEISDDEMAMDWLKDIDSKDISDLRSLAFKDYNSQAHLPYLKKIAAVKPDIGLFVDEDISDFADAMKLFNPSWVIAPGNVLDEKTRKEIASKKNIELLYIIADIWDMKDLSKLSALENIILLNLNQPANNKPLIANPGLKSLTIIQSGIKDISFLANLKDLTRLNLLECDSLTDISALKSFSGLEHLGLISCSGLTDIDVLGEMTSLRSISFNPLITKNEFASFAESHDDIEWIELVGCPNINDMSPFARHKKLSCLTYFDTDIDLNSVYDLKKLKYLSLPDSIYNDPPQLEKIQEKLPNCVIVPSVALCLGSGWLLLIIPVVFLTGFVFLLFRRQKSVGTKV
jgi:hypothetical protein